MKTLRSLVVCMCVLLLCASVWASSARDTITLFVAENGNDDWSGRRAAPNVGDTDGPLASIDGARQAVRRLRAAGLMTMPVRVLVREGTYFISEPIVFEPEDSGSERLPITYANYPGERPVITGGRVISNWWQRVPDMWMAKVHVTCKERWSFRRLFIDGERRPVARIPSDGAFELTQMRDIAREEDTAQATFTFEAGHIQDWLHRRHIRVVVFDDWNVASLRIKELDIPNRAVTLTGPPDWPFTQPTDSLLYYVENFRDALDAPGEWHLDVVSGHLFYRPLPGETRADTVGVALMAPQFLVFAGRPDEGRYVEHITVQGLHFHYAGLKPDDVRPGEAPPAIEFIGARNCAVKDCVIAHLGTHAIVEHPGCEDNTVSGNTIYDGKRRIE